MLTLVLLAVPLAMMASLPLFAHTSTYPVAIVEGNSMYPALHNGDLVYYAAPRGPVKNGTVIVFIEGETGVSSIDALLKPIVIHRVVGFGYQPDGSLYYETKGDNNAQPDPFVAPASSILGIETFSIAYLGLPIQFFKSAYGMLTVVSVLSLYYFSEVDTRTWLEDERKRLLTVFAKHSLDGGLGPEQFERLKMVVECSDLPAELLKDTSLGPMAQWLREGGLAEKWREEVSPCPKCGNSSCQIVGEAESFLVCPNCMGLNKPASHATSSTDVHRSWADRLFARQTRTPLFPSTWEENRPEAKQCGEKCPTHNALCVLRPGHRRSHHHTNLEGSFCFFD